MNLYLLISNQHEFFGVFTEIIKLYLINTNLKFIPVTLISVKVLDGYQEVFIIYSNNKAEYFGVFTSFEKARLKCSELKKNESSKDFIIMKTKLNLLSQTDIQIHNTIYDTFQPCRL
jgi:hypothetical protein